MSHDDGRWKSTWEGPIGVSLFRQPSTRRLLEGVEVTGKALAIDLIHRVGPDGTFVNKKHSLYHMGEHYFPNEVFERLAYEDWLRQGEPDICQRAHGRMKELLDERQRMPFENRFRVGSS